MFPYTYIADDNIIVKLSFIIGFVIICVIFYNEFSLPKGMPPGPLSIPFVGHLPLLESAQYITLNKLGKKYGPIYR